MDSPTNGKTLGEAKIPDRIGIEVLLTNREERWICLRPDVTIKAGDTQPLLDAPIGK